jgi:DNA (cytosine-5)-methyltransferase 1
MRTLEKELGYHVSARILDARSFVPQHRERIIIVGFRNEFGFSLDNLPLPRPDENPKIGSILHKPWEPDEEPYFMNGKVADKYTLTENMWNYLQSYKEKHALKGNGFGYGLVGPDDVARTLSARYYKDGSEILVKQDENRPRRLTPRECARLMGFDRPGENNFVIPVSDTQAYRQFGNSVAVPLITAIAEQMKPFIQKALNTKDRNELIYSV